MGEDRGKNTALRALLDDARLSNTALARAVVRLAAEQGLHLGTNAGAVRRMLAGCQPRQPVPWLVATVLSRRLHREIDPTDCGFADHSESVLDVHVGTQTSATPEGTMQIVAELSGRELRRRNLLIGTMFTAGAFAEPALLALTVPPSLATAKVGSGRRIGMADVEVITATAEHYVQLANRLGAGRIREQVVRFLHGEASRALRGSYTEQTGRALFSAVAHATRVAGIVADDIGRPALAQRYYLQAFNLAMHAGDRLFAGLVLAPASRLAIRISQGAATEQKALHNARHAVALARSGRSVAGSSITPIMTAQLHAVEARGLALLNDARGTTAAADAARRAFDSAKPEIEPATLGKYTEPVLFTELGQGLRDIGCVNRAMDMFEQALSGLAPWRMRDRTLAQTDLAMTYLAHGEIEGALAATDKALSTAEPIASRRLHDRIRVLQHRLQAHQHRRGVAETNERVSAFLARGEAGQDSRST